MKNTITLSIISICLLFLLGACASPEPVQQQPVAVPQPTIEPAPEPEEPVVEEPVVAESEVEEVVPEEPAAPEPVVEAKELPEWLTIPLTDVNTGDSYTLGDFEGKPVLIESFAVWCPICTRQQVAIKSLHEDVGDSVISVALGTDPNENEEKIKNHAQSNGFDWRYSVSPSELTQLLIKEFGVGIVNAPSAPVILLCEDHSARLLGRGYKSDVRLAQEIEQGCGNA